jgi:DUF4097 and DUF4098 domain-containing protein YvlB
MLHSGHQSTIKLLAPLCAALLVAFSAASAARAQESAEFHQSYPLDAGGTVSVTNGSGYIRVTGWGENRVQVDAVKHGPQGQLDQIEIQVTARPDRVEIRTIIPRTSFNFRGNRSVDYDVKVPRGAVLNALSSTSGDISVTDMSARVVARSTSGNVTVRALRGEASLTTTSGDVKAENVGGPLTVNSTSGDLDIRDVSARLNTNTTSGGTRALGVRGEALVSSTSGDLRIERAEGRVSARATSGSITVIDAGGDVDAENVSDDVLIERAGGRANVTSVSGGVTIRNAREGARVNSVSGDVQITDTRGRVVVGTTSGSVNLSNVDSRDVQVSSHSGGVQFRGRLYDDGRYAFESFSSDVVLMLPADTKFTVTAKTFSGEIETDFPLQIAPGGGLGGRPRRLQGSHGSSGGGAQLTLSGFSSSLRIKKQP